MTLALLNNPSNVRLFLLYNTLSRIKANRSTMTSKTELADNLVGKLIQLFASWHDHSLTLLEFKATTTQMIETIWDRDITVDGKNQNLIKLSTFVQTILTLSQASYSTLQVALYYLVLIQTCTPKDYSTVEQLCLKSGRRMFLAALIIASKYLHDRSFSSRAWSEISGLKICEINASERAFIAAANWKFHIPEPVFRRWTDIILEHSTSPRWRSIIPHLTSDLNSDETLSVFEMY